MSVEENKRIILQYVGELNKRNLDAFDTMVDPTFVDHDPVPGQQPGIDGLKNAYRMFLNAFPDVRFNPLDLVCEGDLVVGRGVLRGTHQGTFVGAPATGRKVRWTGTRMFRVRDGKLFDGWINLDMVGLMAQLTSPVPLPQPGPEGETPDRDLGLPIQSRGDSLEENKALFRRMVEEMMNQKNLDAAGALYTAGYTSPSVPGMPSGPEGAKRFTGLIVNAFPDLRTDIEYLVAEGDRVASRLRMRGTHTGDLVAPMGTIPPTGREVDFTETIILRVEGGKFAGSWFDIDLAGVLTQLGVIPPPEA